MCTSMLTCRWWRPQFCPNHRQSATTESLNLETVAGMYLVLLAGIVLSVALCLLQFCLAKYRDCHRQVSLVMSPGAKTGQWSCHLVQTQTGQWSCHLVPRQVSGHVTWCRHKQVSGHVTWCRHRQVSGHVTWCRHKSVVMSPGAETGQWSCHLVPRQTGLWSCLYLLLCCVSCMSYCVYICVASIFVFCVLV